MKAKAWIIATLWTVCLLAQAAAGPTDDGLAALNRGDYETALQIFKPWADHGETSAQTNLGYMYAKGLGVPQDDVEALKWFRKAAMQGSDMGQFNVGHAYEEGLGVSQDYAEALKWYRKAADQGNAEA
jgi:uncharacterized protein